MILIVGLTDYVIRNLLRSSFGARARQLGLRLHAMVYPDIFPAYRDMLESEIGMSSEPQDLVRLADFDSLSWNGYHSFQSLPAQSSKVSNTIEPNGA